MSYLGTTLFDVITIGKIYSIHYFEYMSDFSFKGEAHNFWELVCVDKGEAAVTSGNTHRILKKGELLFHRPNEFHNVAATGTVAPNLVVISFECHDEILNTFIGKVLKIDATERNLLANIIIEARGVFDCRLDDPYLQNMPKRRTAVFGGEQLIKLNLCYFLIHLLRRHSTTLVVNKKTIHVDTMDGKYNSGDFRLFNQIVDYLEAHITTTVTLNQICSDNLIGRSKLQRIFKQISSLGVIEYFSHMKINAAKEMIRLGQLNFTQISEQLGYTSLHYFSRQFKQLTGMSPSEYENSIKAMAEGSFPVENT